MLGFGSTNTSAYVRQAHLRPLVGSNYVPRTDERIINHPHSLNIRDFYKAHRDIFYSSGPADPDLASDGYKVVSMAEAGEHLKYIRSWDDSCWSGGQRMSHKLYGTTHEILVPLWIEQARGVKFDIQVISGEGENTTVVSSKTLDISEEYLYGNVLDTDGSTYPYPYDPDEKFHAGFVQYFLDYLSQMHLADGDSRCLDVQYKSRISQIAGLEVESGNFVVRQDYDLVQNLIARERPLLECNSLITNMFQEHGLICPHLINFNLCLDVQDLLGNSVISSLTDKGQITVKVEASVLQDRADLSSYYVPHKSREDMEYYYRKDDTEADYVWNQLEVRDFYTNHEYIPKNRMQLVFTSNTGEEPYYEDGLEYRRNVLDYKKDYQCTDLIHANKIVQPICHWVHQAHPDTDLFNVYNGFGMYLQNADGTYVDFPHFLRSYTDANSTQYDESFDNTLWLGAPKIGDGKEIEEVLSDPEYWTERGYFKEAADTQLNLSMNGELGINHLYLAAMTTPWESNIEYWKTMGSSYVTSRSVIGILIQRNNRKGENNLPASRDQENSDFDLFYDWHLYSDIDNRFAIRKKVKDGNGNLVDHWLYYNPETIQDPVFQDYLARKDYTRAWEYANGKESDNDKYPRILMWWDKSTDPSDPDDITDRGWQRVGGLGPYNTSMRSHMNTTALYIAARKKEDPVTGLSDLYVVLYHPRTRLSGSGDSQLVDSNVPSNVRGMVHGNLYPHGLTLGGFLAAIKSYHDKYDPCLDAIAAAHGDPDKDNEIVFPTNLPHWEILEVLSRASQSTVLNQEVIWFQKSIESEPDNTLSYRASEFHYYKVDDMNEWVFRNSGSIRPAIMPVKTRRMEDGRLVYLEDYGRNFAYHKELVFLGHPLSPGQLLYMSSGVQPRYPSLDYDSIHPSTRTGGTDSRCLESPHGDLLYNEPDPFYSGLDDTGAPIQDQPPYDQYYRIGKEKGTYLDTWRDVSYDTYAWPEYKWFDTSKFMVLPETLEFIIQTPKNDRATLERIGYRVLAWPSQEITGHPDLSTYQDSQGNFLRDQYIVQDSPTRIEPWILEDQPVILDTPFLRSLYDLEFNLLEARVQTNPDGSYQKDPRTGTVLYNYIYQLKAELR